jgi:two-component system, OmpR family, sensor kinase
VGRKVLAGVLLVTIVALAAFDIAAVSALRGYLMNQTDSRLDTVLGDYRTLSVNLPANGVAAKRGRRPFQHALAAKPRATIFRPPGGATFTVVGPHFVVPPPFGQYYVDWVSRNGKGKAFVQGSADLRPKLPANLEALAAGQFARTVRSLHGGVQLRLRAIRVADGSLLATTSLATVNKTVGRLELILIIGSAIAGLLVAFGVVAILRRGLRPIETMAAQADRISAGDLTDRVSAQDPQTEVGRLATALNGMLARIEASVTEREASQELTRQFFADASHELRNPLASLRANAELYQQGALPYRSQVDEAIRRIGLEAHRMSVLVDDMLRLARLDQHPGDQRCLVDVTALVNECAERTRIADPLRPWLVYVEPDLETTGDEDQIRRAIDNLLANVRLHTPSGTVSAITASQCGDCVVIEVSDNGPGVPADRLPRIFDRFYRGDPPVHSPGSGLGLAIVSAIATAHDGAVEATANEPHGLRITLRLPVPAFASPDEPLAYSDQSHGADRQLVGADSLY